jgi:sugar phosphate isomerase/epimerase
MKLSCLPVSFFSEITSGKMSVAEWARMGAELGLDAIDLSILFVPERTLASAARLRRQIEAAGMRVTMVTTYPDFTHPDSAQRLQELALEQEAIAIAAEIGAELVRVTDGQAHPETGLEQGVEWAIEGLTRIVETTRGSGVTLAFENHAKPGVWTYTDFSQEPEIFLRIVAGTAPCGLKINFDTGNASAFAKDPVAFLRQVLPRVVSIHASDTASKGELRHVLLGTGVTPYHDLFKCLKEAGWDRWICMEEASYQGRDGVEAAARFVKQAWLEA